MYETECGNKRKTIFWMISYDGIRNLFQRKLDQKLEEQSSNIDCTLDQYRRNNQGLFQMDGLEHGVIAKKLSNFLYFGIDLLE